MDLSHSNHCRETAPGGAGGPSFLGRTTSHGAPAPTAPVGQEHNFYWLERVSCRFAVPFSAFACAREDRFIQPSDAVVCLPSRSFVCGTCRWLPIQAGR